MVSDSLDTAPGGTPLFPGRMSLADIARSLRPGGTCERAARNLVDRLTIPYVKLAGVRWYDPDDIRRALLAEAERAPRGRGRPKKSAA